MNAEVNHITVPLSRLQLSPRNVRKTGGAAIEDLAASIAAHGLGQNLIVTRGDSDVFAVEAGGRRLKALQHLAGAGQLEADWPVPCKVVSLDQAAEISLAENQLREAMHPADQFIAIKALVDSGLDEAEVAARFGVTRLFMRQRMKLAKVATQIIDDYRAGKTTLDVVEACAITDDIPRQLRAYKQNRNNAWNLKRALTQGEVEATDTRVEFVGLKTYEAAGGPTHEDMFAAKGITYLRDTALLDRLVAEKLEAEAEKIRAEGWGWVEVAPDIDDYRYPRHFAAKGDKSKFGALVSIGYDGKIEIERWRMKPGQRDNKPGSAKKAAKSGADLSHDMVQRLELHRAAAIREAVAANPAIAIRMLLVDLLEHQFHAISGDGLGNFDGGVSTTNEHGHDGRLANDKFVDLKASPARKALSERVEKWEATIKAQGKKPTIDWLATLTQEQQLELLALCFAMSLQRNGGKPGTQLADALKVDMRKWWTAGPDTFLKVVPKAALVAAVGDVAGKSASELLLPMKKDAAIAAAAQHLSGTDWLPKPLRGDGYALKGAATTPAKGKAKPAAKKAAKKTPVKKATVKKAAKKPASKKKAG